MVDVITTRSGLIKILKEKEDEHLWHDTILRLQINVVKEYKKAGMFQHIRKELKEIHNLKFACTDRGIDMDFYFISTSENLIKRIVYMLERAMLGKYVPLYKCDPNKITLHHETFTTQFAVQYCPVFT